MFKKIGITLLSLMFIFISSLAYAGTGSGQVGTIMAHNPSLIFFTVDTRTNAPSCQAANQEFRINLLNPAGTVNEAGQAQYALLLSAKASGQPVYVTGDDICGYQREGVVHISVR